MPKTILNFTQESKLINFIAININEIYEGHKIHHLRLGICIAHRKWENSTA